MRINSKPIQLQSQEILHHLGTQKDAKLCLKCTKMRLAAGLRPDSLGSFSAPPDTLTARVGPVEFKLNKKSIQV